jgi:long-chain acyl-CoA synthetase
MFLINHNSLDDISVITENNDHITYAELYKAIDTFKVELQCNSIIFIIGKNDYSSLVCYLASLEVGAVPLLLSPGMDDLQISSLIQIYNPKFIFSKYSAESNSFFGELIRNVHDYGIFVRHGSVNYRPHKDLALLLTTSGSTGSPKLVRLSKKNIVSNASSISEYLNINHGDRAITSLPFNYSYGLSVINSHLYSGGVVVLTNHSMMEAEFWSIIRNNSVTSLAGVPYNYEIMLRLGLDRLDISSVKKMTQAGGKLDNKKIQKIFDMCQSKFIDFYTMYGQTEATARISYLPTEDVRRKPNSIGIAIPGGRLWIEDKQGNIVTKDNVVGELFYQGDNVSMGYAETFHDLALGDLNRGILKTGDLAYFDKEKYFYIEGRKNRFLKIFGIRISLDSLEKMITEKGYICAITGNDNKLLLYIIDTPELSVEILRDDIANTLGINRIAIFVSIVEDFPRLETGKINYKLLSQ